MIVAFGALGATLLALFWFGFTLILLRSRDQSDRPLIWFGIARGSTSLVIVAVCALALFRVGNIVWLSVILVVLLTAGVVQELAARRFRASEERRAGTLSA